VVEDDDAAADLMSLLLEAEGLDVLRAASAEETLPTRGVSTRESAFLLWDGTSTGYGVVTSGASLALARVAWLGFVCMGELPEILDLVLQLDHLEFTPNNQPLELL
jgi:hypothetical protein